MPIALAATVWFALYPGPNHPHLLAWDKAEHFLGFAVLGILLIAAAPGIPAHRLLLGLLAAGGLLELLQATPLIRRDAELDDWLAELAAVGVIYAVLLLCGLVRRLIFRPHGPALSTRNEA